MFGVGAIVAGSVHVLFVVMPGVSWEAVTVTGAYGTYDLAVAAVSAHGNVAVIIDAYWVT